MRSPETLYRGQRKATRLGVPYVVVAVDDRELLPDRVRELLTHHVCWFEWGYRGAGPFLLALALVYDATGSEDLARRAYRWFAAATVECWGKSWEITAGEIHQWLAQFERECRDEPDEDDKDEEDPFGIHDEDLEQRSEYQGDLQCPVCQRIAHPVEWPTKNGVRHCPVCATKRAPQLVSVPLAVRREGAA